MVDRAVAPVVGKVLEIGLVVVYVSVVSAALYGGVVPDYRAAAGEEVGERVLATAAGSVEDGTPGVGRTVAVRERIDLPTLIHGSPYEIRADGETLVLEHPHPDIGGRVPLALPDRVLAVRGAWQSTRPMRLVVTGNETGVVVELVGR